MSQGDGDYRLELSFYTDTEAYSDRDRLMFTAGFEFCLVVSLVESGWRGTRPVHRENESRLRMALGRLGRDVTLRPHDGYAGCETWSDLTVG